MTWQHADVCCLSLSLRRRSSRAICRLPAYVLVGRQPDGWHTPSSARAGKVGDSITCPHVSVTIDQYVSSSLAARGLVARAVVTSRWRHPASNATTTTHRAGKPYHVYTLRTGCVAAERIGTWRGVGAAFRRWFGRCPRRRRCIGGGTDVSPSGPTACAPLPWR